MENFHLHPLYIEALTERINTALTHFDDPGKVHLVFSAHGLPLSLIAKGDPYERQIGETVRAVMARGAWPNAHTLCYQSRVGRQKWLGPPLEPTIERLAAAGAKHLLVIPISFVTEHIETLHEINIEARAAAMKAGVEQFEMMAAVGDSPRFIGALADVVRTAVRTGASERASAHCGECGGIVQIALTLMGGRLIKDSLASFIFLSNHWRGYAVIYGG